MNNQTPEKVVLEKIKRNIASQVLDLETRLNSQKLYAKTLYDVCDPENPNQDLFNALNRTRNRIRKIEKKLKSLREQQVLVKSLIKTEVILGSTEDIVFFSDM